MIFCLLKIILKRKDVVCSDKTIESIKNDYIYDKENDKNKEKR